MYGAASRMENPYRHGVSTFGGEQDSARLYARKLAANHLERAGGVIAAGLTGDSNLPPRPGPLSARSTQPQGSAAGSDWASSAARGLSSLATNVSGLVNQFRGQGAAPSLPSWSNSFQTPLSANTLAAFTAPTPSAFQPSGGFSAPWTFPSAGG